MYFKIFAASLLSGVIVFASFDVLNAQLIKNGNEEDIPSFAISIDDYQSVDMPFTSGSWWNTPLPENAPIHPDSDMIIAHIREHNNQDGTLGLAGTGQSEWGMPRYVVDEDDPVYNVERSRYRLPDEFSELRIPLGAEPMIGGDHAMVIYDPMEGYVVALFEARYDEENDSWSAGGGDVAYLDGNGIDHRATDGDPRNHGPGRGRFSPVEFVHKDELFAGELHRVHKIAIRESATGSVWPMVGSDGRSTAPFAPPQGTRLRIKPHIDLDQYNLHPQARVIAEMIQKYGLIIGDTSGGGVALKLERNYENWPNPCPYDIGMAALRGIPIEDYEVIEFEYRPEITELKFPENDSEDIAFPVTLEWERAELAESYNLQVSADRGFNDLIVDTTGIEGTEMVFGDEVVTELLPRYYWRVQYIRDGDLEGSWSQTWTFDTETADLKSPDNGIEGINPPIILEWHEVDDAEEYNLQISTDRNFNDLVLDTTGIDETILTFEDVEPWTRYYWRIQFVRNGVKSGWSDHRWFQTPITINVESEEHIPGEVTLNQNYPNPFNPVTTIEYALPEQAEVRLDIYDMLGRRVTSLVNEVQQAGTHRVRFDAGSLSSGAYIYHLQAGDVVRSMQMILMK